MTAFAIMNSLNFIARSEQYKAAWVFTSAPLRLPGTVMGGAFKAMMVKYFLPFFICISTFVVITWGWPSLLDIILAFVNITLFSVLSMRISNRFLPFSQPEQMNDTNGRAVIRVMASFIVMGLLGVGHYLASFYLWLKIVFLVLSVILLWLLWDSYSKTTWNNLEGIEEHD
jgi:hypothetical protein